jgi:hypothetical protein
MPVNDDVGILFLLGRKRAIVVRVEKPQDQLMRLLSAMVLEYLNINARRIILAQAIRDLDPP